jgi:hypothetical protein
MLLENPAAEVRDHRTGLERRICIVTRPTGVLIAMDTCLDAPRRDYGLDSTPA